MKNSENYTTESTCLLKLSEMKEIFEKSGFHTYLIEQEENNSWLQELDTERESSHNLYLDTKKIPRIYIAPKEEAESIENLNETIIEASKTIYPKCNPSIDYSDNCITCELPYDARKEEYDPYGCYPDIDPAKIKGDRIILPIGYFGIEAFKINTEQPEKYQICPTENIKVFENVEIVVVPDESYIKEIADSNGTYRPLEISIDELN